VVSSVIVASCALIGGLAALRYGRAREDKGTRSTRPLSSSHTTRMRRAYFCVTAGPAMRAKCFRTVVSPDATRFASIFIRAQARVTARMGGRHRGRCRRALYNPVRGSGRSWGTHLWILKLPQGAIVDKKVRPSQTYHQSGHPGFSTEHRTPSPA